MEHWLAEEIDTVPDFEAFPSVDGLLAETKALADTYPEVASVARVGTSRLGEPLTALRVAGGASQALAFAAVHPNEPIGGLTALHLARRLCAQPDLRARLGCSWTIIPCIDPDGMRLNEGWFGGPFVRSHYGRHFYRPAAEEQVEWTFPFQYKDVYFDAVLPETLALMRLIDDLSPAVLCSLHNGELGGVYYYLSRPLPEVYRTLQEIPEHLGLPLELGEPEAPYVQQLDHAIYRTIRSEDSYDFAEAVGLGSATHQGGTSSAAYAERHGTLSLISELPYWVDPLAQSQEPCGRSYRELLERRADRMAELAELLADILAAVDGQLATNSPMLRASRAFVPVLADIPAQDRYRAGQDDSARPATVAEQRGLDDFVHCFRLRYGGMLLRGLQGEVAVGNGTPTIRSQLQRLEERYQQWAAEGDAATPMPPAPIRALVATQYGAILATTRAVGAGTA